MKYKVKETNLKRLKEYISKKKKKDVQISTAINNKPKY
tara:strand:+ start:115 stop:228 length:114 start_codon:yes stop_codon:yes gene_type:complete